MISDLLYVQHCEVTFIIIMELSKYDAMLCEVQRSTYSLITNLHVTFITYSNCINLIEYKKYFTKI